MPIQSVWADSKADALANAAGSGDLEQVKTLIEKEGVDINAKESKFGATALMVASNKGQLEVVKYLINKGADAIKEVLKNAGAKSEKEIKK